MKTATDPSPRARGWEAAPPGYAPPDRDRAARRAAGQARDTPGRTASEDRTPAGEARCRLYTPHICRTSHRSCDSAPDPPHRAGAPTAPFAPTHACFLRDDAGVQSTDYE